MWVQLINVKYIEVNGEQKKYNPGDWVPVGKQTAMLWMTEGSAKLPDPAAIAALNPDGSGILTDKKALMCKTLQILGEHVIIDEGVPGVPFNKTAWVDSLLPVRPELIPVGLLMLETWEMAVPLMDYSILAVSQGNEAERNKTREVIRDLRVPVYDTRLMFLKKTPIVEKLIASWLQDGATPLAFLRRLYQAKPLILALPCTWTQGRMAE